MLDTNICIYVDRPSEVRRIFNERAEQLCISSVSQAELHYGAAKSESSARNLGVVGSFAARLEVLPFEEKAAARYGETRAGEPAHRPTT